MLIGMSQSQAVAICHFISTMSKMFVAAADHRYTKVIDRSSGGTRLHDGW